MQNHSVCSNWVTMEYPRKDSKRGPDKYHKHTPTNYRARSLSEKENFNRLYSEFCKSTENKCIDFHNESKLKSRELNSLLNSLKDADTIETIKLCQCVHLSNHSITLLAKLCKNIRTVDISECKQLTDKAIQTFTQNCKDIETINISGCVLLTDKSIELLKTRCENLKALYYKGHNLQKAADYSL